jgi:hypothetical protein
MAAVKLVCSLTLFWLPVAVAQIINLPAADWRLVACGPAMTMAAATPGGLPIRDTADCQSALLPEQLQVASPHILGKTI